MPEQQKQYPAQYNQQVPPQATQYYQQQPVQGQNTGLAFHPEQIQQHQMNEQAQQQYNQIPTGQPVQRAVAQPPKMEMKQEIPEDKGKSFKKINLILIGLILIMSIYLLVLYSGAGDESEAVAREEIKGFVVSEPYFSNSYFKEFVEDNMHVAGSDIGYCVSVDGLGISDGVIKPSLYYYIKDADGSVVKNLEPVLGDGPGSESLSDFCFNVQTSGLDLGYYELFVYARDDIGGGEAEVMDMIRITNYPIDNIYETYKDELPKNLTVMDSKFSDSADGVYPEGDFISVATDLGGVSSVDIAGTYYTWVTQEISIRKDGEIISIEKNYDYFDESPLEGAGSLGMYSVIPTEGLSSGDYSLSLFFKDVYTKNMAIKELEVTIQ